MIAKTLLVALIIICVVIEKKIKSASVRTLCMIFIIISSAFLMNTNGMNYGKIDQLNRFARLLPHVFLILGKARSQPKVFDDMIETLLITTRNPEKLDEFEKTVNELEQAHQKY